MLNSKYNQDFLNKFITKPNEINEIEIYENPRNGKLIKF